MSVVSIERRPSIRRAASLRVERVCLVTEASGGGVGRHFLDLAGALTALGIDVVAFYSPARSDEPFQRRLMHIQGVRFIPLPMRRAVHPGDFAAVVQLIRCLRREGPFDVVHGHSSKGGAIARLAARWLGIPSVYTPHAFVTLDPQLSRAKRRLYGLAERSLAQMSAAVIAVSQDEARHAHELGIKPAKVHIVHNGIEPPAFASRALARQRLGFDFDEVVIGFVGRLVPQKAPDFLVAAFPQVAARCPLARLAIVGSGPLEADVRAQIQRLGVQSLVRLVGEADAADFLPAFDVFCLPSRYEGLPYVLLEALAAELPIVATYVGGATTCVTPGENGFLVENGNPNELAAALGQLAADPTVRANFSAASAARAQAFSLQKMVNATLDVYDAALAATR